MELDANGRPQPTGQFETLEADAIVLALGQETDSGFLHRVPDIEVASDGTVRVGHDLMTGHPGIFAGGDMVAGERSVTVSVGHGKRAARHIDAWLRGEHVPAPAKHPLVSFDMLHLPVYSDADPSSQKTLALSERAERLRGNRRRPDGARGALRSATLPLLRQLLRMRQLFRRLSGGRHHQARAGPALSLRL